MRVSEDGWFLIGFGRDAAPEAELVVSGSDGGRERLVLAVAPRQYRIERIDGLPAAKVAPRGEEELARIDREARRVAGVRTRDDPRTDFRSGFRWPVTGRISGVYGSQRILNGVPRQPHYGIDIAAPAGTKVRAPADGLVTFAEPDLFLSGGTLIVDHGHGLSSAFLHLSRILVARGERVSCEATRLRRSGPPAAPPAPTSTGGSTSSSGASTPPSSSARCRTNPSTRVRNLHSFVRPPDLPGQGAVSSTPLREWIGDYQAANALPGLKILRHQPVTPGFERRSHNE